VPTTSHVLPLHTRQHQRPTLSPGPFVIPPGPPSSRRSQLHSRSRSVEGSTFTFRGEKRFATHRLARGVFPSLTDRPQVAGDRVRLAAAANLLRERRSPPTTSLLSTDVSSLGRPQVKMGTPFAATANASMYLGHTGLATASGLSGE
jgi:hypothetical protein